MDIDFIANSALTIRSKYDRMVVKQKYNICIDNISVLEGLLEPFPRCGVSSFFAPLSFFFKKRRKKAASPAARLCFVSEVVLYVSEIRCG